MNIELLEIQFKQSRRFWKTFHNHTNDNFRSSGVKTGDQHHLLTFKLHWLNDWLRVIRILKRDTRRCLFFATETPSRVFSTNPFLSSPSPVVKLTGQTERCWDFPPWLTYIAYKYHNVWIVYPSGVKVKKPNFLPSLFILAFSQMHCAAANSN